MDPAPPLLDHLWTQATEDVQTQGPCCFGRSEMDFFPSPNLQTILSHAKKLQITMFLVIPWGSKCALSRDVSGRWWCKDSESWRFYRCPAPEQKNLCTMKNHNSSAKSHLDCKTTNSCSYNRSYHLKSIKKHCISSIPLFGWKCALFCATLANSSILKGLGAVSAVSRQVFRSPRIRKLRRACRSFRAVSCYMRGERAQGWWRDRASVFSSIVEYSSIHIYMFLAHTSVHCLSINHESSQDLFTYQPLSLYQSINLVTYHPYHPTNPHTYLDHSRYLDSSAVELILQSHKGEEK